jgi:hypothetical protein
MVAEAGIEPALRGLWDLQGLRPFPPHRELVWSASWRGQRDSNPYSRADNAASFPSTMSPSGWSARGDSNPDLHGLNVPRLPIAPRAEGGGDHGRIRTATGQALDLLPLPGWATWPLVPPGGLEPPLHGLRARRAAFTLRREWSEWRDSNPHLKAWKARRQPLPHIRNVGPVSFTGPSTSVGCQRPRSCELVGGKGFEPKRSR